MLEARGFQDDPSGTKKPHPGDKYIIRQYTCIMQLVTIERHDFDQIALCSQIPKLQCILTIVEAFHKHGFPTK